MQQSDAALNVKDERWNAAHVLHSDNRWNIRGSEQQHSAGWLVLSASAASSSLLTLFAQWVSTTKKPPLSLPLCSNHLLRGAGKCLHSFEGSRYWREYLKLDWSGGDTVIVFDVCCHDYLLVDLSMSNCGSRRLCALYSFSSLTVNQRYYDKLNHARLLLN